MIESIFGMTFIKKKIRTTQKKSNFTINQKKET